MYQHVANYVGSCEICDCMRLSFKQHIITTIEAFPHYEIKL
jgi:hypothetical protein